MRAALTFQGFNVDSMYYRRNYAYWKRINEQPEEDRPIDMQTDFSFNIVKNPENYLKANIGIGVKVGKIDEEGSCPFEAVVNIVGFFSIENEDPISEELALKFYSENAVAILFPFLRSLVYDITGRSDHQPILLPTLNIAKVAKEYFQKEQEHLTQEKVAQ